MLPQSLILRCIGHKTAKITQAIHLQTFGRINPPIDEKLGQEVHYMESVRLKGRSTPLFYFPIEFDISNTLSFGFQRKSSLSDSEKFLLQKSQGTLFFYRLSIPETLSSFPLILRHFVNLYPTSKTHWFALVGFELDKDNPQKITGGAIEQIQKKISEDFLNLRKPINEFQVKLRTRTSQPWKNRNQLKEIIFSFLDNIIDFNNK